MLELRYIKHSIHVSALLSLFVFFVIHSGGLRNYDQQTKNDDIDSFELYGTFATLVIWLFHILTLLPLPGTICHFCGLVFYNIFPLKVQLTSLPLFATFVCIRVVTRGDYAQLVEINVDRNIQTCLNAGLVNFIVEVVTDKALNLRKDRYIREIVVPDNYICESDCKYKARALQYALEDDVNNLNDNDWIVHLDEETLLTENSVKGILNFIINDKHKIGQGKFSTFRNYDLLGNSD